jgi:hypothetical protein
MCCSTAKSWLIKAQITTRDESSQTKSDLSVLYYLQSLKKVLKKMFGNTRHEMCCQCRILKKL